MLDLGESLNGTILHESIGNLNVCSGDMFESGGLWYTFIGTGGQVRVDTCKFASIITSLNVFTGDSCDALECDTTGLYGSCEGLGSSWTLDTIQGVTYYVLISSQFGAGSFELTLSNAPPPPNDLCSNAASISSGQIINVSTIDATIDDVPDCEGNLFNDTIYGVWYHFKSSATSSRVVANTCMPGRMFTTAAISVYSGTCDNLVCIDKHADPCSGGGLRVEWQSEPETDYLIVVDGQDSASEFFADFQLELVEVPATPTASPAPSLFIATIPVSASGTVVPGSSTPFGSPSLSPVTPPSAVNTYIPPSPSQGLRGKQSKKAKSAKSAKAAKWKKSGKKGDQKGETQGGKEGKSPQQTGY
jgi:hypothetical protein